MTSDKGVSTIYTNLMARASIINSLLNNPLLFYSYDIQDGDTPEIVADKYYGDSYRYWLIMFANGLLDPQWDWPLNSAAFNIYMNDKYATLDPTSIHHFEKIVTQYDSETQVTSTQTFVIDQNTFLTLPTGTTTIQFPTSTCTITISGRSVSYYEYEMELNESKRSIKLLKKEFALQIEKELASLMSK